MSINECFGKESENNVIKYIEPLIFKNDQALENISAVEKQIANGGYVLAGDISYRVYDEMIEIQKFSKLEVEKENSHRMEKELKGSLPVIQRFLDS